MSSYRITKNQSSEYRARKPLGQIQKRRFTNYSIEDIKKIISIVTHLGGEVISKFDNVAYFKFTTERHAKAAYTVLKHQGFGPSWKRGEVEILVVV